MWTCFQFLWINIKAHGCWGLWLECVCFCKNRQGLPKRLQHWHSQRQGGREGSCGSTFLSAFGAAFGAVSVNVHSVATAAVGLIPAVLVATLLFVALVLLVSLFLPFVFLSILYRIPFSLSISVILFLL